MTNNFDLDTLLPDFGDYSTDEFLEKSTPPPAAAPPAEPKHTGADIAARSRRAVEAELGDLLRRYTAAAEEKKKNTEPQEKSAPAVVSVCTESAPPHPTVTVGDDGIFTLHYEPPEADAPAEDDAETAASVEEDAAPDTVSDDKGEAAPSKPRVTPRRPHTAPTGRQDSITPLVRFLAKRLVRRQHRTAEAAAWPDPVEVHNSPEMSPAMAAKYYKRPLNDLCFRCRTSFFLCLILAWIAFGFPMAGMLGCSVALQAGVSLVLSLTVAVIGLDIITAGIRQILELRPNAESFVVLSLLFSAVDAVLIFSGHGDRLPFCAVGAFAVCIAIWGKRLSCSALVYTFRTVAEAKTPSVLIRTEKVMENEAALLRTDRSPDGFVRRSEQPDLCQNVYALVAPYLLLADLLLSIIASLNGQADNFLHTFSALLSVSTSFSAFLGFALPYEITARHLRSSGVAIAGSAGCIDIGATRRIVLTDNDLFPPGTIRMQQPQIFGSARDVVSFTASILRDAGCGSAGIFAEFMKNCRFDYEKPEDLLYHEGGGLTAVIRGRRIRVGSTAFMTLMGVRLPKKRLTGNILCTAIENDLVGVFDLDYIAVPGVQDALVTLMRSKTDAIFAIRDFNITPLLLRRQFRLPTDNFNFLTLRERHRIASLCPDKQKPMCAVLNRPGMMTAVDAAEAGRKLYRTAKFNLILSLLGGVLGLLVMFLLCHAASFDTANVGNVLTFMLLWTAPVVILSIGQTG